MSILSFEELELCPEIMTAIQEIGYTAPTAVQAESIPLIRSGVDILAQSQTGTGKTMAFAIPAVEMIDPDLSAVQVLVLSPTRELSQQCGDEIRKVTRHMTHVKTADIYGGADFGPQFRALRSANVVIGTPGRVMDHMRRDSLKLDQLKMVVLDEADEMLNMGFKEDIETILQDVPEQRQIVLFSATIPDGILAITKQFLNNPARVNINREQVTLDNIKQTFVEVPMYQKQMAMKLLMHYYRPTRAIVFANTKSMVDELVDLLNTAGFYTQGLHGDMKQPQRTSVMQSFRNGQVNILVATDVAARGIDVSDVDYVFNYDIPKMNEYYVHRIGRTGRAGRTGTAVTLCTGRRQVIIMQQLARHMKSTISALPLPTLADIERSHRDGDMDLVVQAMQREATPLQVEALASLMEQGHTAEEICMALMGLAFRHNMDGLVDLKMPERSTRPTRADRGERGENRSPMRNKLRFADFVLNVGNSSRVSAGHIVAAVTEAAGIPAKCIGKISIDADKTTVGVFSEHFDTIMDTVQGIKICGQEITVSPLAEPRRAGVNPRPRFEGKRDGERKPYGDRKPYGERKSFGDRKPYGGDRKRDGERKFYGDRKRDKND